MRTSFVLALVAMVLALVAPANARVIHVYAGESIQEAIDLSKDGDAVVVHPGTYVENIVVNNAIDLVAPLGPARTTVTFEHKRGPTLMVDGVTDAVILAGFTVIGSNQYDAVRADGTRDLWIEQCTLVSGGVYFSGLAAVKNSWVHAENVEFDGSGGDVTVLDSRFGGRFRRCGE